MSLEQPQSIRTIFFDAGFTLLRAVDSTPRTCQRVCRQFGLYLQLDDLERRMGEGEDFFLRQVRQYPATWASNQSIREFWVRYYMHLLRPFVVGQDEGRLRALGEAITGEFEQHSSWCTYPDVLPTLEALYTRGYRMGIISDWGMGLAPIVRNLGLTRYFDSLLISASARHAKPSPMLYELALQRANAIADYTLHIGDSYIHDVLGARAVGMTPVLLDRAHRVTASSLDCAVVHSLYELLDLLEVPRSSMGFHNHDHLLTKDTDK
jgi:putative hydrolase of the HAD superfamily